jgi:thiamine biosynthesis lipoprotein
MPADWVERSWRAMGSAAVTIVVGGPDGLADLVVERVEDLESKWSRFRPASELSRLNERAGASMAVSADTIHLLQLAIEGWRVTEGRFDPTIGDAVVAAGYDESFDRFDGRPRRSDPSKMVASPGAVGIEVDESAGTALVPVGVCLDAGGIGKGLAADLVVDELLAAGADGAMVSLGGDVRVRGRSPDGDGWTVGIADPGDADRDLAVAALGDGAVATSSTLRRRWTTVDGRPIHHLLDPRTGTPGSSGVVAATVIAASAATAEVLATACVVGGIDDGTRLIDALGAGALAIDSHGERHPLGPFESFLVEPFPLTSAPA